MIKPHPHPIGGNVAIAAGVAAGYVIGTLACGTRPVVTGGTCPDGGRMVKSYLGPPKRYVTVLAGIRGRQMACAFTRRLGAVVAVHAASDNKIVVKIDRVPVSAGVT